MSFHENPIERVESGLRPITSFNDIDVIKEEVKQYVHNQHHRNWKIFLESTSKAMPCRGQLYQKHKYDRAFEIIEKSFTYGSKLKRNPISEHERERNRDRIRLEKCRFELYRRAWMFKYRKSNSLSSIVAGDKHVFTLDWGRPAKAEGSLGKKRNGKKSKNR